MAMTGKELIRFLRKTELGLEIEKTILYRIAVLDECVEYDIETVMNVYGSVMYEMGINEK